MRNTKLFRHLSALALGLPLLYLSACEKQEKVEIPPGVAPGLTVIPQEGNAKVLLVNEAKETVHSWDVDADRARLLPNCHLLVVHGTKWGIRKKKWKNLRETVTEYDREGNPVWQYTFDDVAHHDVQKLDNGDVLTLRRTIVPTEYQMTIDNPKRRRLKIRSDSAIQVSPSGEKVWEWHSYLHLDLNHAGRGGINKLVDDDGGRHRMYDWTHMNSVSVLPENKWFRQGDARFKPGNLMVHSRNWSQSMIVDRDSGEVVWEYTGDFKGGISGGHEAHMLPENVPGAGNILIFDNGRTTHAEQSIVIEVDPITKKVVWHYEDGKNFYSRTAGSAQRLPNGNTLISEDKDARVFEVNRDGEIVWEYQSALETNRAKKYPREYCS